MQTEMMLEVPSVRLDFTKAQLLLLVGMQHSWMGGHQSNNCCRRLPSCKMFLLTQVNQIVILLNIS